MKTMKSICLSSLVGIGPLVGAPVEQFRTDINPALQYYQAFLLAPNFEQTDRDFLEANEVFGHQLPDRFGKLMARYDAQFSLVRRAVHASVPCDWGIDMTAGSSPMLPHLARAKAVAQIARSRAMWDLQQARSADACEDLLAALALGRNLSRSGIVISVLVQNSISAILCSAVAENFGQYSQETLRRLADGFSSTSTRGTVAGCIPSERVFFQESALNKILELQRNNPGNDARVMEGIHQFLAPPDDPNVARDGSGIWDRLAQAAGGTSEGMLKLFRDRERSYDELKALIALPYPEYQSRTHEFVEESQKSGNPLIAESVSSLARARDREFRILATLEMVRAAVEYKMHGEAGLQKVTDPCGKGPFSLRRFIFEEVDRGFELKSAYDLGGDPAVLIFVEKAGTPFRVSGPQAGQAVSKESGEDAFRRRYGIAPGK